MNRALVLACGNSLRGDDGAALHIVRELQASGCPPKTEIRFEHQWTPELAESISQASLVIFVDSSITLAPGKIACHRVNPIYVKPSFSHETNPALLLALAQQLYGAHPAQAYLVTVGAASFEMKEGLSDVVQKAIPHAVDRIKKLLTGMAPSDG